MSDMTDLSQYARLAHSWLKPPAKRPKLIERQVAPGVFIGQDAKGQPHIIYGETTRQHLHDLPRD